MTISEEKLTNIINNAVKKRLAESKTKKFVNESLSSSIVQKHGWPKAMADTVDLAAVEDKEYLEFNSREEMEQYFKKFGQMENPDDAFAVIKFDDGTYYARKKPLSFSEKDGGYVDGVLPGYTYKNRSGYKAGVKYDYGTPITGEHPRINEQILKNKIKGMIREMFESMGGFSQFEANDSESDDNQRPLRKSESGKADFNDENQDEQERRAQVEKFFNKDGVDIAPYAYKLYHIERHEGEDTNDMKNARSKFMKCLNHEPNEAGYPYSFSSDETNKLQSMISSNQLNEAIKRAVKSATKKMVSEIGYHEKQYLANKPYDKGPGERQKPEEMWSDAKKGGKKPVSTTPEKTKKVDYKGTNPFDHMSDEKIEEAVKNSVRKALKEWASKNKK